jgi:hypothetical protein
MGLSAPAGLWNLSNLNDVSGNGRTLTNKGVVAFDTGVNGLTFTAAKFSANTLQALYSPDTGAADPLRIRNGSWGCWARTPRRGATQYLFAKSTSAGTGYGYFLAIQTGNAANAQVSTVGTDAPGVGGTTDICDDRWHFIVATFDSVVLRIYVDGVLEGITPFAAYPIYQSTGPICIGGYGGDASNNTNGPCGGRVDEVFITNDVLTEEQIRLLYCARIPHSLGVAPTRASINIHRRRKGATPVSADFVTAPLRWHTFTNGSIADSGTQGVVLQLIGGTAPVPVAGADGTKDNAVLFGSGGTTGCFAATDAGLPAALTPRSFGCWFKLMGVNTGVNQTLIQWGTYSSADARLSVTNTGLLQDIHANNAYGDRFVADGLWHLAVIVHENTALDGMKRKMYLDGRLVASIDTIFSITLVGNLNFRLGQNNGNSALFNGIMDSAFVCDFAMPFETIAKLYAKGAQDLGVSPKNTGDHIERMDSTSILATFDTIDTQNVVDMVIA